MKISKLFDPKSREYLKWNNAMFRLNSVPFSGYEKYHLQLNLTGHKEVGKLVRMEVEFLPIDPHKEIVVSGFGISSYVTNAVEFWGHMDFHELLPDGLPNQEQNDSEQREQWQILPK